MSGGPRERAADFATGTIDEDRTMQMEMPTTGPAHEKLAQLSGKWVGEETMMPSPWNPEESKRHAVIDARVLEGFFVVSDYEQKDPDGNVSFRGHGVYSYDAQADEYKMYWFDSMGGAGGVATGKFDGDTLTFRNTSPMGHHSYSYTFGDGTTRFEMAMSPDGENWQTLMVGEYKAG